MLLGAFPLFKVLILQSTEKSDPKSAKPISMQITLIGIKTP